MVMLIDNITVSVDNVIPLPYYDEIRNINKNNDNNDINNINSNVNNNNDMMNNIINGNSNVVNQHNHLRNLQLNQIDNNQNQNQNQILQSNIGYVNNGDYSTTSFTTSFTPSLQVQGEHEGAADRITLHPYI